MAIWRLIDFWWFSVRLSFLTLIFIEAPSENALAVGNLDLPLSVVQQMIRMYDFDKNGTMSFEEFVALNQFLLKGEVQYFIGVQLDGSQHVEPLQNSIPVSTVTESEKLVKETAQNVDVAVRELPDANKKPEDLWANHSKFVRAKPHRKDCASWIAIQKVIESGEPIGLKHFKPVKPLGSGDTGSKKTN